MTRLLKKNNFSQSVRFGSVFIAFVSLLIVFTHCAKPAGKVGALIQPEDSKLKVGYSDTSTVYAFSIPDDSIITSNLKRNLIGSTMDPVFGGTTSGFYTQLFLQALGKDFGPNPVLDSLIFQLAYLGHYGDTNTTMTVHAYELSEDLHYDSAYYSDSHLAVYGDDYANFSFQPRPNDSLIIGTDTVTQVLRINLSNYNPGLGNKLLSADTSITNDLDNFLDFFKGLYLVTEPVSQGGSILTFDLESSKSRLKLYYKNDTITSDTSLRYDYFISLGSARFNSYEHDFSKGSTEFVDQVIHGDTMKGHEKFYTKGLIGTKAIVRTPFIKEWRKKYGHVAINEAKLVLNGYEQESEYEAPARLALVKRLPDNTYDVLMDQVEGENYFDGKYDAAHNRYTFRITRHIQSLINDTSQADNGMAVYVYGSAIFPSRFIFNGNDTTLLPPENRSSPFSLELIYTLPE